MPVVQWARAGKEWPASAPDDKDHNAEANTSVPDYRVVDRLPPVDLSWAQY